MTAGATNEILAMRGIVKRFGSFAALSDVDFSLQSGEVHVLFGENGAGKSTLIQIIAGVHVADEGEYTLLSQPVVHPTPAKMQYAGVSAVFQEFSLIPDMTVTENVFLGREISNGGRLAKGEMRRACEDVLKRLGFAIDPDARVRTLRRAHQQMVEITKALLRQARVIIFDEPSASLADQEAAALFDIIEGLKAEGIAIVYISHRMSEIDRLADRVTVLRDGRKICTLTRDEISHERLVTSMTGRSFESFYPHIERRPSGTAIAISGLKTQNGLVNNVSLDIKRGEVLGIAGLAGCGKSELIRAVFGLEKIAAGAVSLDGKVILHLTPAGMLAKGICYMPSDRAAEGLAMRQGVSHNTTIASLDTGSFSKWKSWLRLNSELKFARDVIDRMQIKTRNAGSPVDALSGGNKQKVLLARGLSRELDIYLFDEPTVGVDVQAKVEIYTFIKELTEAGKAVVIASSDMAEVIRLSHRLVVMREGRIVSEMEGGHFSEEGLLSSFFGRPPQPEPAQSLAS
jgi:ribose transport system ATP-binding protein